MTSKRYSMDSSALHNPDILTCLANLSSDEVFTPPTIANEILNTIPADFWSDPGKTVLDPTTKSGVFLREAAKRFMIGLADKIPNEKARIDHILKNQLYGLPITELTSLISKRTLYCSKYANSKNSLFISSSTQDGNIPLLRSEHVWIKGKCEKCGANEKTFNRGDGFENHAYPLLHEESVFNDMKFDLIVGNPPYHIQDSGDTTGSSPIYHKFVQKCIDMEPEYLCMIIPSRWFAGGKGLDEFRVKMMSDKHIRKLVDYPIASDVFPGLKVIGGVCYFLWQKSYSGECEVHTNLMGRNSILKRNLNDYDVFVRFNDAIPILEKILSKGYETIDQGVSTQKPFGLRTFVKPEKTGEIRLYANKAVGFINRDKIEKNEKLIYKHKVFISMAYGEGGEKRDYPRMIIGKPIVVTPPSACTETYLVAGSFDDEEQARNFSKFLKTRFCRFLVALRKNTQHITPDRFKFVPELDMKFEWDDDALFELFGISKIEQKFICSLVRPME